MMSNDAQTVTITLYDANDGGSPTHIECAILRDDTAIHTSASLLVDVLAAGMEALGLDGTVSGTDFL